MSDRATHLHITKLHALEHECRRFTAAFGYNAYLVGSALERQDYRDVDLRLMLPDEEYDAFIGANNERLTLLNDALSDWLAARTGLPVDFQFQRRTEANEEHDGRRNAVGLAMHTREGKYEPRG